MDKVIIIDGIDVSGCEFCMYKGFKAFPQCKLNKDSFATACVQHKDCYYKQLKRLQAEYDDLHLTYAGCKTANTGLQELNEKLQAENERLKEEVEHYRKEAYRLADGLNKIENLAFIYKQALQEIKDMATLFHSVNENKDLDHFKNNILDKINEVIGAEE